MPETTIRNIELDEVPELDELVTRIRTLPLQVQVEKVSDFVKAKLKNALVLNPDELPDGIKARINYVFDQQRVKKLSECIQNGYGVCLDYHVLALAIFNRLGIPAEFKTGRVRGVGHTFLDILVNERWCIFDPFAEVFLAERGSSDKLFSKEFYAASRQNH